MTSARRMELRLNAWRSFRGIARASRTLAATQALHWAEHLRRVVTHESWCVRLVSRLGPPPTSDERVSVAIGTDLGLCGPLNARVADAVRSLSVEPTEKWVVVGERLASELSVEPWFEHAFRLPVPSSFEAVEGTAAEVGILPGLDPTQTRLRIVVTSSVEQDGAPNISIWNAAPSPDESYALPRGATLTPEDELGGEAAGLLWHARLCRALTRAATSEAEARWRAMSRAHDASDRKIGEQERELRKLRQESITQEMLEVRQLRAP